MARSIRCAARSKSRPGECVPDRLLGQIVGLVPLAGALVQQRHLVWMVAEHPRPQHVGEQVVVAVPLASVVQGDKEQVGALQSREHVGAVLATGDRVGTAAR